MDPGTICEVLGLSRDKVDKVVKSLKNNEEAVSNAVNAFLSGAGGAFADTGSSEHAWAEKTRRSKKVRY
jgi:hypothetical protein